MLEGRLLLIGDAGKLWPAASKEGRDVEYLFDAIRGDVARAPDKTIVVWLGDNAYERGLPLPPGDACGARAGQVSEADAKAVLKEQIRASARARTALFVPGNHDWDRSGPCGLERVRAQEAFIENDGLSGIDPRPRAELLPDGGCPGPAALDADHDRLPFLVVALGTEWFLREGRPKPVGECARSLGLPETANEAEIRRAALGQLTAIVRTSGSREVVVVAHHPLRTHGPHGGYAAGLASFFTSLKPLAQDLGHRRNRKMVEEIEQALAAAAPKTILAYASGHDHSLQVLRAGPGGPFFLVSGSGTKTSGAGRGHDTFFKHAARGYMRIDALRKGANLAWRLAVIEADEKGPHQLYSTWLKAPTGQAASGVDDPRDLTDGRR